MQRGPLWSALLVALLLPACAGAQGAVDITGTDLLDAASEVTADLPPADLPAPLDLVDAAPAELPAPDDLLPEIDDARQPADLVDIPDIEPETADVEPDVAPFEPVPPAEVPRTAWGGYLDLPLAEGTGFFATAVTDGRAWLVDPDGHAFFSLGLQAVSTGSLDAPALGYAPGKLAQHAAHAEEYGSWSETSAALMDEHLAAMLDHGFNTVGGWSGGYGNLSGHGIAYSVSLGFSGGVQGGSVSQPIPKVSSGGIPDVFHTAFEAACLEHAQKSISAQQAADPWNIGYYSDNELRWWGKDYLIESKTWTLADDFIALGPDSPGKQAFVSFVADLYDSDVAAFNAAWQTEFASFDELLSLTKLPFSQQNDAHAADRLAFVEEIARRYFEGVSKALDQAAPDQLFLGVRFASVAPDGVIRQSAKHSDVVTFNDYYILPDPITEMALGGSPEERWSRYCELVAEAGPRPIVITEWGIRADDSGLPNTFGAGFVVDSQRERADFYRHSADWFLSRQWEGVGPIAGWHWFMYLDEPPTGRFDGEDGNYGVVTIRDEKYRFLWEAMAAVNRWVDNLLVPGTEPTLLLPPETVTVTETMPGLHEVSWAAVPGTEGYRVHVLSHPAGIEGRILDTFETPETTLSVLTGEYGMGTLWLAVEPTHETLLAMGPRMSKAVPVTATGTGDLPGNDEVLACETLRTVTFHNALPLPNDEKGQSYATLTDSFLPDGGQALRLEFLPSSLGYIFLSPLGDTALRVDVALPDPPAVTAGDSLTFHLRPDHAARTNGELTAASDLLQVQLLGSGDTLLGEAFLGDLALAPAEPAAAAVPVTKAGMLHAIRFQVDLFTPQLALEQVVSLTVDFFELGLLL